MLRRSVRPALLLLMQQQQGCGRGAAALQWCAGWPPPSARAAASSAGAGASSAAASAGSDDDDGDVPEYVPSPLEPVQVVHKLGLDLLHDPLTNAGTAFTMSERERLGLRGLLPPKVTTLSWQKRRFMQSFEHGDNLIPPEELPVGVDRSMAIKWKRLSALQVRNGGESGFDSPLHLSRSHAEKNKNKKSQDRNESLFYMLLAENFEEMAPIVYTPTVGWACSNYSRLYRRPRGMFFSVQDKGQFASMALNWPRSDVQAIVVTDGSRILGLGDLGLNGMGIAVGKLDLYVAAAGFSPRQVLPVVLDAGTDNERLLADPLYMGVRRRRLKGKAYYELVDELIAALTRRWPKAVIQFEDFGIDVARPLLERYRRHALTWNDDVQGTASTALGGLYAAMKAQGLPRAALAEQRVVVVGAGSAGMGVVETVAKGMARSVVMKAGGGAEGALDEAERAAQRQFWVLDKDGLITSARRGLPAHVVPFARPAGDDAEGESLLSVVRRVKPTVLMGLAGAGKLFTPDVLRAVADGFDGSQPGSRRPVIFALSNPTSRLECTAQEAFDHTKGRAIYASGSPQPPLQLPDGRPGPRNSQANNLYVFAGISLGAVLAKTRIVSDGMLMAAAEVLPDLVSADDLRQGVLFPPLSEIRAVSAAVAAAVMRAAQREGLIKDGMVLAALAAIGDEDGEGGDARLRQWVTRRMWRPQTHTSLAYLPPGIGE